MSTDAALSNDITGERYSLLHLGLLHHFTTEIGKTMGRGLPELEMLVQQSTKLAYSAPYLMDELIAFSAAHKSVVCEDMRTFYRSEATRLQTRALAGLNALGTELSGQNCMALFWFSAILGQHVMFDTFSSLADLATVLDRFVQCLSLHRGIRTISSESWPRIQQEIHGHLDRVPVNPTTHATDGPGDECAALFELLTNGSLDQACREDVVMLQHMFQTQKSLDPSQNRRIIVTQEWLVRVSVEFVDHVNQRRPEALVVLAYYGVLLHRARDYWAIRDAGNFLIRSIGDHLGSYWSSWLEWPLSMLET